MKTCEKQILYDSILRGEVEIQDLTGKQINELKVHWFDSMYKELPPIKFHYKLCDELRRREVEAASKKIKPIDKDFFK